MNTCHNAAKDRSVTKSDAMNDGDELGACPESQDRGTPETESGRPTLEKMHCFNRIKLKSGSEPVEICYRLDIAVVDNNPDELPDKWQLRESAYVSSPDLPGLMLRSSDPYKLVAILPKVIEILAYRNLGKQLSVDITPGRGGVEADYWQPLADAELTIVSIKSSTNGA